MSTEDLNKEIAALKARLAQLEAERERGVVIGRDMKNSVAVAGDVHGDVIVGAAGASPKKALRAYCEVVVSSCSHLPLRAVDVAASDATGRPERVELDAI